MRTRAGERKTEVKIERENIEMKETKVKCGRGSGRYEGGSWETEKTI